VVVVGEGGSSRDLVKGCMWVDERSQGGSNAKGDESGSEGEVDGGGDNRSKIAWRYGGMEKFKTSVGTSHPVQKLMNDMNDLLRRPQGRKVN
jgi:hypothetical protein